MDEVSSLTNKEDSPKWVCIDFVDTVEWRASDNPTDRLTDYARLLLWSERNSVLSSAVANRLREKAAAYPTEASAAFDDAIALREAIYRIFFAVANNLTRHKADIELLNRVHREAMTHKRLNETGGAFSWHWSGEDESLHSPIWRIAESAANLLTAPEIKMMKTCPGEGCAWLFLDTSRNHSRRWCEMQLCGNRTKVRKHRSSASLR
ncbi:MAG: ABATE domain-containing protein [Chloroflexota bacterium]